MKTRHFFLIGAIIFIMYIASAYTNALEHEEVHKAIFNDYGINSTIRLEYNPIKVFRTGILGETTTTSNNTANCNEFCKMLQSQNEIATYNMYSISNAIFFAAIIFLITVGVSNESN